MSEKFNLVTKSNAAFGMLAILNVVGQPSRRFTAQESEIVARALDAVATGASAEKQIYMSPIASDHDFEARVESTGVVVTAHDCADAALDWDDMLALAEALKGWC